MERRKIIVIYKYLTALKVPFRGFRGMKFMIKREDLVKIGQFNKPHGIKGEISFTFTNDVFDRSECKFLICEIEGIFVPFVIEEYRFKSNSTALILLKDIKTDIQAKLLTNLEVYFPKPYVKENESSEDIFSWDYFIGYQLIDNTLGEVGLITDVDETTINVLFFVERVGGGELLIPASDELITEIDTENKRILIRVPEGLIDL